MARLIGEDEIQAVDESEISSVEEPTDLESEPETGILEAGARGLAQGLTAGFADEITASLESALTPKTYKQSLKESQAEYKKAEEEYPTLSTASEIGGGLAQAVALSIAGTPAAGAASGAGKISKAAQLLKNVLNPTTKAGLLKNVGTAAVAGGAQGALQAVGKSEEQGVERLKEAPAGLLSGALVGGALTGTLGLAGKGIEKIGEGISKKVDEGKYLPLVGSIRQGFRSGMEGRGFATEANLNRSMQEALDVAENVVRPEILDTLSELREFREGILKGSSAITDISDIVTIFNKSLKSVKTPEADKFRQTIKSYYDQLASEGQLNPFMANNVAKQIKDFIKENVELSADIKRIGYTAANDIKNQIAKRIPDQEAIEIVSKDPALLSKFRKYIRDISDEDLSMSIKNKLNLSDKEAAKKAKEIKNIVKTMSAAFSEEDPEAVSSIVQSPQLMEQFKKVLALTSPVKVIDTKMNKLLNASEILGDVVGGRSEAEALDDVVKIFKNIIQQPKDSADAFLSREKFKRSLDNIREVNPELAKNIEEKLKPIIANIKYQRTIMGEGFEKGEARTGLVRGTLKDVGSLVAEGANLAAQTAKAAEAGIQGPLPLTSTLIRPTTSIFQSAKSVVDDILAANPDSKPWKSISETLGKALAEKDENRRAALLNTLMQYESFRNIIGPYKKDK